MLNHSFRMKASQPLLCRAVSSIRPMTRTTWMSKRRSISIVPPPWRPASVLDKYGMQNLHYFLVLIFCRWVEREARPISLRQLTFFGRLLTDTRLLGSANYVRLELPTRLLCFRTTYPHHFIDCRLESHTDSETCKHYLTLLWSTHTLAMYTNFITRHSKSYEKFQK